MIENFVIVVLAFLLFAMTLGNLIFIKRIQADQKLQEKKIHDLYYLVSALARIQGIHPSIVGRKAKEHDQNIDYIQQIFTSK